MMFRGRSAEIYALCSAVIFFAAVPCFVVQFKNYIPGAGFCAAGVAALFAFFSFRKQRMAPSSSFAPTSTAIRVFLAVLFLAELSISGYAFYAAADAGETLSTHSKYLGGIAFIIAAKWAAVLFRRTSLSRSAAPERTDIGIDYTPLDYGEPMYTAYYP